MLLERREDDEIMSKTQPKLFDAFAFAKGITLRNRIVMAPMTTWSGNEDGTVSDEEVAYYRRRAKDVGLVITGCTHVMPNGVGFTGEFASCDDSFTPSLRRLAGGGQEWRRAGDPPDLPRRQQSRARTGSRGRDRQRERRQGCCGCIQHWQHDSARADSR
jgi:hypothetical protein